MALTIAGCDYVLHSTAQLYSHKRKHERRDFESAYKRFRDHHPAAPGLNQMPQQPGTKPILPRPDPMSMLQFQTINGKPAIPTLASMSGLKRPADMEPADMVDVKKIKLEPLSDVDGTAPSSPAGLSDDQSFTADRTKFEYEQMDAEASNMSECSSENHGDDGHSSDKCNSEVESINLSGSLSLPIQTLKLKTEPMVDTGLADLGQPSSPPAFPPHSSSLSASLTSALVSMNPGTLMTIPSTLTGASTILQPPKSIYTERREKDDSWKTYLVR